MDEISVERRLTSVEERSKSNTHRLDAVEKRQNNLDELVGSVKVLAMREETLENDVKEIKADVKSLTEKPAKRWDALLWEIARLLIAVVIGFVIAAIGIKT